MKITFYGVRGSIPVPTADTIKYGGNTSCVHIRLDDGKNIIFDAGTGIRQLGHDLVDDKEPIYILLSHNHWDHIHGYPFFKPNYQKGRQINVYASEATIDGHLCSLLDQMDGAHFPIEADQLPSETSCILENIDTELYNHGLNIKRKRLNHPGEGYGFRIEEDGVSCAFITDNELEPPDRVNTTYEEWVEFCRGVNVLIHDAQYIKSDMPHKHGWGHSLISQVRKLALDAETDTLVLFHHDPDRTDSQVQQIQQESRSFFKNKNSSINAFCAREGMVIKA